MADLFASGDLQLWSQALAVYKDAVKALDDNKKSKSKGAKKQQESLVALDKWYQDDLPLLVSTRSPPHLTHEELARLMTWKLTRGKFRPRLTELVKENSADKVKELTTSAFSQLPKNVRKAVEILKTLKAVGPATASAILCIHTPGVVPFMSDEATSSVPSITRLDYTLTQYMTFQRAMCDKAEELNGIGDDEKKWTAHTVELCLWSYVIAKRLRPSLLQEAGPSVVGGQDISRPSVSQDNTSDDDSFPQAKRPKTNKY